mgnify:CR=1 FL=1
MKKNKKINNRMTRKEMIEYKKKIKLFDMQNKLRSSSIKKKKRKQLSLQIKKNNKKKANRAISLDRYKRINLNFNQSILEYMIDKLKDKKDSIREFFNQNFFSYISF